MIKQLMISMMSDARDGLIRTAQAVPEDKLNWRPMDAGRTVLDLLGDATQVPKMISGMLESRGEVMPSMEMFQQFKKERENWTREESIQHLQANCEKLFALVETTPDEELSREITLPFGGGMKLTLAAATMMAHRTMANRFAQINYIQTLYGDTESH